MDSSGFRSFLGLVKFAFGSERVHKSVILFGNKTTKRVIKAKLRGVSVDEMLSWDHHIESSIIPKVTQGGMS